MIEMLGADRPWRVMKWRHSLVSATSAQRLVRGRAQVPLHLWTNPDAGQRIFMDQAGGGDARRKYTRLNAGSRSFRYAGSCVCR